jgi:hypothetical protein
MRLNSRDALGLVGRLAAVGVGVSQKNHGDLFAGGTLMAAASAAVNIKFPKGAIIQTILKDMPPESLGEILVHEHLQLSSTFGMKGGPGARQPTQHFSEDLDLIVDEMKLAQEDGLTAIVDCGHLDQGRRAEYLRQISKLSGIPVVISCGYLSVAKTGIAEDGTLRTSRRGSPRVCRS